ncbi:hypothetical protein AGOR_G00202750 [Albula goreensis]|uniref:IF rod domain-containing protein n=1 Tax=Albula goreensis TaxID=1534307 RepID=A0A8T3CPK5_9TELE|nr:hypothetical protein AGOR_G00202750 [Albula goreensis]
MEMLSHGGALVGLDSEGRRRDLGVRLKDFLEHVRSLQEANAKLQEQIAKWSRDAPQHGHWTLVEDLRAKVSRSLMENAQLGLQCDCIQSEAAHMKARCEAEERRRRHLEQELVLLRGQRSREEHRGVRLQAELHRGQEELEQITQEHHQAVQALQQSAGQCDAVLVSAAQGEDGRGMELSRLLDQIRTKYDHLVAQNQPGPGPPGPAFTQLQDEVAGAGAGPRRGRGAPLAARAGSLEEDMLHAAQAELTEAKRQWRSLQMEIESLHAVEKGLETSLHDSQLQYELQLQDMSRKIHGLEEELGEVRSGLESQRQRHHQLLNTKVRLEHEIATYRRLLEREEGRVSVVDVNLRHPGRELRDQGMMNHYDNFMSPKSTAEQRTSENGLKKSPPPFRKQKSLVILPEPEMMDGTMATVKTEEILQGNVVQESAEAHGTVERKNIDVVIKKWEGSFFKGNPKLRKKSVSLRFDLHMAAADEGCAETPQDSLPDVEVRLVMKRSRSIPSMPQ